MKDTKILVLRGIWIFLKNIPLINKVTFIALRKFRIFFWKYRGRKPVKLGPANIKLAKKINDLIYKDKNFKLIEIGCAAGATLIELSKKYPQSELKGLDIRIGAIKDGNNLIKRNSIKNLSLEYCDLNKIEAFEECDYLISRATLIYLSSEELINFLTKIKTKVRKKIFFQEIHSNFSIVQKHYYFAHPYNKILKDLGFFSLYKVQIDFLEFESWKSTNWNGANIILERKNSNE